VTDLEYQLGQSLLINAGHMLSLVDLDAMIDRISVAESAGAVLNPTLYLEGIGRLEEIKAAAIAARQFCNAIKRLDELVIQERVITVARGGRRG
jgi:hypothetical protein